MTPQAGRRVLIGLVASGLALGLGLGLLWLVFAFLRESQQESSADLLKTADSYDGLLSWGDPRHLFGPVFGGAALALAAFTAWRLRKHLRVAVLVGILGIVAFLGLLLLWSPMGAIARPTEDSSGPASLPGSIAPLVLALFLAWVLVLLLLSLVSGRNKWARYAYLLTALIWVPLLLWQLLPALATPSLGTEPLGELAQAARADKAAAAARELATARTLQEAGRVLESQAVYQRALEEGIASKTIEGQMAAVQAGEELGTSLNETGRESEAKAALASAAQAALELGKSLDEAGKSDEARAALQQAVALGKASGTAEGRGAASEAASRVSGAGPGKTIALENGITLDPATGGVSGVGLGTKGRVTLSEEPVFKVRGADGIGYLRVVAGETYTGNGWLPAEEQTQAVTPGATLPLPLIRSEDAYARSQVTVSPILPLGRGPVAISLYTTEPQGATAFDFGGYSHTLATKDVLKNGYAWRALAPVFKTEELRRARTVAVSPALLQLPASLPMRVRDLAKEIVTGETNDYDKLVAIRTYLQRYTYDLDNAATPPGRDAVDFFLFDDKRGICSTFSSAFIVLARAAGIPARVVGGWAIAPTGEEQVVRAKQAHQWAEAPFHSYGWVTFEATVGGPASRVQGQAIPAGTATPTALPAGTPKPAAVASPTPVPTAKASLTSLASPTATPTRTPTAIATATSLALATPTSTPKASATPADSPTATPARTPTATATATSLALATPTPTAKASLTPAASPTATPARTPTATATPTPLAPATPTPTAKASLTPAASPTAFPARTPTATATPTPDSGPLPTRTEITGLPPRLRKGESADALGTVSEVGGAPVSGLGVEVYLNTEKTTTGGILVGIGSVAGGRFAVRIAVPPSLPPGDYQVIAHTLGDARYLGSWSDPTVEVYSGTNVRLTGPTDALVGDPVLFSGRVLQEDGTPIAQGAVEVTVEGRTYAMTAGAEGAFEVIHTFTRPGSYTVAARYLGTNLLLEKSAELQVRALLPTRLSAVAPKKARRGSAIEVVARLEDDQGGPVVGARLSAPQGYSEGTTGSDGAAVLALVVPRDAEAPALAVQVQYAGDGAYASASTVVAVSLAQGLQLLMVGALALTGLAGFGAGCGAVLVLRRRSAPSWRTPTPEAAASAPVADTAGATLAPEIALALQEASASLAEAAPPPPKATIVTMDFPQATPPMPPVWGVGEPLAILCRLTSEDLAGVADAPLQLEAEGQEATVIRTGEEGRCVAEAVFARKGESAIRCAFQGASGLLPSEASALVRIVDYREEVVELFNGFLAPFRDGPASVPRDATPREAEVVLVSRQLVRDERALDALITAFEEANYSLHPIRRQHYLRAYLALQQLRQKEVHA